MGRMGQLFVMSLKKPGKRILIVEDDYSLRRILSISFEKRKIAHTVRSAANGEEALLEAKSFSPDILLIDLGLPRYSWCRSNRSLERYRWPAKGKIFRDFRAR